jgi:superoxide dismutase, Fe-Mn family
MKFSPPQLPYGFRALEPAMSRETLWFHFSRHQRACFEPAAALIRGTELDRLDLEEVVLRAYAGESQPQLFHHAAGLWNHQIFWQSMRPGGGGAPYGYVGLAIQRCFGSYENFVQSFMSCAANCHGSGWIWVTAQDRDVRIVGTANSDSPLLTGQVTLLGLDLWEHAFYLDHHNRRIDYVLIFLEELVNWDFANENLYNASRT